MKKLTKEQALEIMKNSPWTFYYSGYGPNIITEDGQKGAIDEFYYKNHEVIDEIGSDIRTIGMGTIFTDDYTDLDKSMEVLLKDYPNRYWVPRLNFRTPDRWNMEHPEELCVYGHPRSLEEIKAAFDDVVYDEDGYHVGEPANYDYWGWGRDTTSKSGPGTVSTPSFSSKVYIDYCAERLQKYIEHIENSPYADQVLGYFVGGMGNCGENMWPGDWRNQSDIRRGDFGIANTREFRSFLIEKYGTIENIRKAYNDESLELEDIYEPYPDEYWSEKGMTLDELLLANNQKMVDTAEFHCKATREAIERFSKICFDISGKPNGCFYGYMQDETVGYAGHLWIDELLKSPYVDFMSSPKAYHYCLAGDPGASQAPGQSIQLKPGKLFIEENDSRSYHSLTGGDPDRAPKSLDDTVTVFWREIYRALTMDFGFWWMDIRGKNDDWYSDEVLVPMLKAQADFYKKWAPVDRKSIAQVVFVEDEDSCAHMAQCSGVARNARYKLERELRLCGVPVDHLRVCDLLELPDVTQYKFIVFCHAFVMPQELWGKIKAKINPEATILWNYAPAMIGENGFSFENQTAVTGFRTRECGERELHPDQYKHLYWHGVHLCKQDYPLLDIVDDGELEVLQRTDDGHIITARRKTGSLTQILTVDFALRSKLITEMIEKAGVDMLAPVHVAVIADEALVGLFPRYDAEFDYVFDGKYRDVITGETLEGSTHMKIEGKKFRIFEKI